MTTFWNDDPVHSGNVIVVGAAVMPVSMTATMRSLRPPGWMSHALGMLIRLKFHW